MDDTFLQSIDKDTLVLTANRRLASDLHHRYAEYKRRSHQSVWETPSILPLNAWLFQLWTSSGTEKQILSPFQERTLWKSVSHQNWSSISTIQQAWNHLIAWEISLEDLRNYDNDSVMAFYRWASEFSKTCSENNWITPAEIPQQLLSIQNLRVPSKIYLSGFDDFPPLIHRFLNFIEPHCAVTISGEAKQDSKVIRVELDNKETEIQQMATWAHQYHLDNPNHKIACIVPSLASDRPLVSRIFKQSMNDASLFNISAGEPLSNFLLIQTALKVIRLLMKTIQENDWQLLLQSPYLIVNETDIDVGAIADTLRRKNNFYHIGIDALLPILTALHARFPQSTFLRRWNALISFRKSMPVQQKPSQWVTIFLDVLNILQWPGSRTLNSLEHQLLQRWLTALDEFAQSDAVVDNIDYETALSLLTHHINDIIFQAKSSNAPIQILGVLEAAGLNFDAIWIMGLDNENWPPAPSPNPFIPYHLQVKNNMPHASAARELTFSRQLLKRLLNAAEKVTISSPISEGDRALKPSPLIVSYERILLEKDSPSRPNNFSSSNIEFILDDQGPCINENEKINGGTFVLKYQSLCPFSAFANIRLNAEPLETPNIGLSGKLRGQILHQVLQIIWQTLQNQTALLQMSSEALDKLICNSIESTLTTLVVNETDLIFSETEKIRLTNIIREWLNIEKERPPFTVLSQEKEKNITIGQLSFQCRIDRIDQIQLNKQCIIDYKSGYSSINNWFSDRPSDPQLPIYCSFTHEESFEGLMFAQIRAGALQFKGITSEHIADMEMPGVVNINELDNVDEINDWKCLMNHWQQTLTQLSNDFFNGNAEVNPLENACDFCELQPLCRVNECQM